MISSIKRTLLFHIISFIFFAGNQLQAQQWHYYNPTSWFDVNAVEIPAPGIIAIGGGHETRDSVQVMFQSIDYGLTWIENPHDGLAPWNKSIAFSDHSNGLAVGYNGRIIRTDDAGEDWGYNMYPTNRDLNKIVYTGSGTYYIAGGKKTRDSIQTILKSTDYGSTWNVIRDTLGPWLRSITFTDSLKGFAVGDKGVILSTTNGGNTWVSVSAPVLRDFNAITFINADTGYIVGGNPPGLCRRTILHTVNGGLNWSLLVDEAGGILKDISFADKQLGYIVGDSATVLQTTNGGLNWAPVIIDTNLAGNEAFNVVKFYNRNFGVIGGKGGSLYIYVDRQVEVFTLGLSAIGNTDATLLGGINTHNKNARYSFVYSDNVNFTPPFITQEINVRNDSLLFISEHIQGLTPNTNYYYFIKASTATDTVYGGVLSFYTGVNPSFAFQTTDATGVTTWRASLNGFINKFREPVSLFFEYGSNPSFGSQIPANPATVYDTLMHNVQATINGIQANNQYFFKLKAVTPSGTYYGNTKMFFALNLPLVSTGNPVITSFTSAQLNGYVGNNGLSAAIKFEFGTTLLYGTEVNAVPDSVFGTNNVSPTYSLTGLTPGRTYHFRLKTINSTGTSYGEDIAFITSLPIVYTNPATGITLTSARLNGVVNARGFATAIKFEYGLTASYGTEVIADPDSSTGTNIVAASYLLTGLSPATTYHYRLKAVNADGTAYGEDMSFIPGGPSAYTLPASNIGEYSVQLNGTVNANNFPTVSIFEYGITSGYGNEVTAIPDTASGITDVNVSYPLTGLAPSTTYHFRIKATNANATYYGRDYIFTTGAPAVTTFPPSDITPHTAQLNGAVIANNSSTVNMFEYGTSSLYENEVTAIPGSAMGNITVNIYFPLSGLSSNTFYHYRAKAINTNGTTYGDDIMFTTYHEPPTATTQIATEISPNSARLHAKVNPNFVPVIIKFDVGLTTSYDSEINANIFSASDSADHNVYSDLNNLIPDTRYHFRIKVIFSGDTVYGNDMIFFTGQPEIPNYDFEIWDSTSIDFPDGWTKAMGLVTKYSPACSGNYAVKIQNTPDGFIGATIMGLLGNGFYGIGVPFCARPDSLAGCFNYHIDDTDTSWIALLLTKNGNPVSKNIFSIVGNSNGNFVNLKFPIHYDTSEIPDSLILVLSSSNFNINIHSPDNWLIADDLHFSGTSLNIPNNDFEQWHIESSTDLAGWYYQYKGVIPADTNGSKPVLRTVDAAFNKYAAKVKTFFKEGSPISGSLWNGSERIGKFPVYARHQTLTGYYKFFPQNGDTMCVSISMFKNGTPIGRGDFLQKNAISSYTPFNADISYFSSDIPDSASIYIQSFNRYPPSGSSVVYIDNLNFDGFLSVNRRPTLTNAGDFSLNVYPNPFSDQATVSFTMNQDDNVTVRLFDLSGKQIAMLVDGKYKAGNHRLQLSALGLQKGFYICVITTNGNNLSKKIIIY